MAARFLVYNILPLGEKGVGKASVIKALAPYQVNYQGIEHKLIFWEPIPPAQLTSFLLTNGSSLRMILYIFDVTSRATLLQIPTWMQQVGLPSDSIGVLVGNKIDGVREVSAQEAQDYGRELGLTYVEISATTGQQVEAVRQTLTRLLFNYPPEAEYLEDCLAATCPYCPLL